MKNLLDLYLAFVKIGAMMFGGGYAVLPILEREIADKKKWANREELLNYYAVGQCTPGIIAVNVSTFIGHKKGGVLGGILATAGMVTPPLIIITILARVLSSFTNSVIINHAFAGVRLAIAALILNAVLNFRKASIKNIRGEIIFAAALIATLFFNISPVVIVITAITIGIIIEILPKRLKRREQ